VRLPRFAFLLAVTVVVMACQSAPVTGRKQLMLVPESQAIQASTQAYAEVLAPIQKGPDPGGKTGATVTPETTKAGQPSVDGTAASKQSGASGAAAPGVARDSTDPSTGLASGAEALKQQRDGTATQPQSTSPTSPSTPGQSR
jgi:hypothetical protein